MKMLSKNGFNRSVKCIELHGRNLEKAILDKYFYNREEKKVINELRLFQNLDGGFGHGLEPDFHMPKSSPMASTIAFQIINKLNTEEQCSEIIKKGINYFERTYNHGRKGWYSVSEEVNNYPHASWWNFNSGDMMSIIDENWGNPTAEIVSYIYKYKDYVNSLNVDELLEISIKYLLEKPKFTSQYEVYCFIKLYNTVPLNYKERIKDKLTNAVSQILCNNINKWDEFVPYPLRIIKNPTDESFLVDQCLLEKNLDYIVDYIEEYGMITPKWKWDDCLEDTRINNWKLEDNIQEWEKAKNDWIGVLTLEALMSLGAFKRITI